MSEKIVPAAVLMSNAQARFEFCVRWLLGKRDLPRVDDRFDIQIHLLSENRFMQADGTFGTPGEEHSISVRPRPFAMIDPPRVFETFPDGSERKWDVATEPKRVSCDVVDGKAPHGFTVCHLLSGVQQSWVQADVERLLGNPVAIAVARLEPRALAAARVEGDPVVALTRDLSHLLVRRAPRPRYLPRFLALQYSRLTELTAARLRGEEIPPGREALFALGPLAGQWLRAAVAFDVLRDEQLLERLDKIVGEPASARQQVRLRALQGGTLVDFWCSPDAPAPSCATNDRGRTYPASELIGTGFTIGSFAAEDLEGWLGGSRLSTPIIEITVTHVRTQPPGERRSADGRLLEILTEDDVPLEDGLFVLLAQQVQAALRDRSSLPPRQPRNARVNYDLLQTNAGDEVSVHLGYRTGEARLEVVITPAKESAIASAPVTRAVFGYNLYGMWEVPQTQRFFDDPTLNPTIAELRPWLMSRKYSYERDLKGAFPSSGAGEHPALVTLLSNPPWQPILERVSEIFDENVDPMPSSDGTTPGDMPAAPQLPNVFCFHVEQDGSHTLQTTVQLDLRAGMDSGNSSKGRRFVGWDRDAAVKTTWDVTQTREGTPAGPRPQRYRFWVTATDVFEQESAPVPVLANDPDAGEPASTLFEPRRRASLLPPPAADGTAASVGRMLSFRRAAEDGFVIGVTWETPFLNDTGRSETAPGTQRRARKEDLVAAVRLFGRRLRRKVDDGPSAETLRAFGTVSVFDAVQWRQETARLEDAGWSECGEDASVFPPASGETWRREFTFTHATRGFEFTALVGVRVRDDRAAFWLADAPGTRTAFTAVKEGGAWAARMQRISETPRTSAIVETEGWSDGNRADVGPLPVPNPSEPRGVKLGATTLLRAAPVLPPPRVSRDTVLSRLLTREVDPSTGAHEVENWGTTGIRLTTAQAAMLETALKRSTEGTDITDPLGDPRLAETRLILARGVVADDRRERSTQRDRTAYRQNATVGFRGLLAVPWSYAPFSDLNPARRDEAEAERVRIFCVTVPWDRAEAERFATVRGDGRRVGSEYELQGIPPEQLNGVATIERARQPAVARFDGDGTDPVFATVTGIATRGSLVFITVPANTELPDRAAVRLYVAQPIVDVPIVRHDEITERTTYLPIGGGEREVMAWWLQTISAQQVVSGHTIERRPHVSLEARATVEPTVPRDFQVVHPAASNATYALDPIAHKVWLPTEINTPERAQHNPRALVQWAADARQDVSIEIAREERLADRALGLRLLEDTTAWEAIAALDELRDDQLIDARWIDAIRGTWLAGREIEVPDNEAGSSGGILIKASASRPLLAAGLKAVDGKATFIDYFRHVDDGQFAMDGNYEYRHRIRAYRDVFDGRDAAGSDDFRFLRSRWTPWTEWLLPEPSGASITTTIEGHGTHDLPVPGVLFRLSAAMTSISRLEQIEAGWFYRVTVKRLLRFSLPSSEGAVIDPGWVEVAEPAVLRPGQVATGFADVRIDRPELNAPAKVEYAIEARQLVLTPDGRERLVRVLSEKRVAITIPPPATPVAPEVTVMVKIGIA